MLRPVRALLLGFAPGLVLRTPDDFALLVGQFLRGTEVVALVPEQFGERLGLGLGGPQRVFVEAVVVAVHRLFVQAHVSQADGLHHGYEAARFVEVVDDPPGFAGMAHGAVFPGQGVAVPAIQGVATVVVLLAFDPFVFVPAGAGQRAWGEVCDRAFGNAKYLY